MKKKVELQWVRAPHQDRSRKTLMRILDAGEALLLERGLEAVSVAEIAAKAGVSVGAIYARFRDKNGLLQVLHERFCEEAAATADLALAPARWEDAATDEIIGVITALLVRVYSERAGLLRAFLLHGGNDPYFQEREDKLGAHFLARLEELLLSRREEIHHPEPVLAISFGMGLVLGWLQSTFVLCQSLPAERGLPTATLEFELARAYQAYLGMPLTADPPELAVPKAGGMR
jgi:AcrR family transcriptional regulator